MMQTGRGQGRREKGREGGRKGRKEGGREREGRMCTPTCTLPLAPSVGVSRPLCPSTIRSGLTLSCRPVPHSVGSRVRFSTVLRPNGHPTPSSPSRHRQTPPFLPPTLSAPTVPAGLRSRVDQDLRVPFHDNAPPPSPHRRNRPTVGLVYTQGNASPLSPRPSSGPRSRPVSPRRLPVRSPSPPHLDLVSLWVLTPPPETPRPLPSVSLQPLSSG